MENKFAIDIESLKMIKKIESYHLNYKYHANFIDLCKTLKSCECIEELAIKMDLMGI